ncbi:hypothetical protein [Litchfieldella xinjiangensis]|uniref:hypothetical protein n=1 Tax=Litchfieldella xinjiangensis TaxID=1166948 RepID=UPI0005B972FA|nr:hypothetical protein [Halomonas xinjiangensis]
MPTYEWARNSHAIEDARDDRDAVLVSQAVAWAVCGAQAEATELYSALADEFFAQGNNNASSCETNRAIEIILDAYLEEQKGRAAA